MRRKMICLVLLACLLTLLTGCGLKSGDDLYALPKTSVEYESLQRALQALLDGGLEYTAPLSGSNTQPVQDVDLNRDGIGEAVAFFKDSSGKESSLQVYVFEQDENGEYEVMTVLSGQGSAVNSVTYCQLDDSENREIVISWQISSGIYALSAYSVFDGGSQELLPPQNYTRYAVLDMDGDSKDELILLHLDASDVSNNRAEYYGYLDGGLAKLNEAYLSADLASIDRTNAAALYSGESALYVTGYAMDAASGEASTNIQITDVLTLRDNVLVNVTRDEVSGSSQGTRRRTYVADQDLNGDGVWEIPVLSNIYERMDDNRVCVSETFYLVSWIQYDRDGNQHVLCTTYYNSSDGWYLVIPEEWKSQIALSRSDYKEGATVERSIWFYVLEKEDPKADSWLQTDPATQSTVLSNVVAKPFMVLYKNSGTDRVARAVLGNRMLLNTGSEDALYSVELDSSLSEWTEEDVQENLHIIVTNWSNE